MPERREITFFLASKCGYNCVAPNYRLAPENRWPAQTEDCLSVYEGILENGYKAEDIIFMGESAGGTLVLSTAILAKQRGIPQPKAIVSFSPVTNQYESLPSHTLNIKKDYMLGSAAQKGLDSSLFGARQGKEVLTDPVLSPYYADYEGIAPVFLSASDYETLLDDSVYLYNKLKEEGHRTELCVKHGLCHAFQMFPATMPEAAEVVDKALEFCELK